MSCKLAIVRAAYWFKGLFEDPVGRFHALEVESGDRILEIGCEIGYHTFPLAQIASGGKVYALDIWEEGLTYLKNGVESRQNIEVMCCSAKAVELPLSSLDTVFCFDTLHDVPHPGQAVEKWVDFLKGGGKLLYLDPSIPPEKITEFSKGRLYVEGTVEGVTVFVRQ